MYMYVCVCLYACACVVCVDEQLAGISLWEAFVAARWPESEIKSLILGGGMSTMKYGDSLPSRGTCGTTAYLFDWGSKNIPLAHLHGCHCESCRVGAFNMVLARLKDNNGTIRLDTSDENPIVAVWVMPVMDVDNIKK
jgi:hypothetical protein